ncbi:MAG: hypothetical protein GXP55_09145 [Deltaproteobacteria bacterium]|nr:hypothetical protein [Deltaproteobacteria bacterium]
MDVYASARATSGKLKLKAKARLADGRPAEVFDACVLLHEAARAEQRAIRLVDAPQETRFAALVEACFCFVEGLDPHAAGRVYSRLYQEREGMSDELAASLLSRLTPRYESLQEKYAVAVGGLVALGGGLPMVTTTIPQVQRAQREAKRMTSAFPGVAGWWWVAYRIAESRAEAKRAWNALTCARRLEPDNARFEAISLLAATKALEYEAANEYIGAVRARIDSSHPELCLMYALAELRLARARPRNRKQRWTRALDVVRTGLSGEPDSTLRNNLRATQLLLESYIDQRKPSLELLYRAGLTEVAIGAPAETDIQDLLMRGIASRVRANDDMEDAA